MNQNDRCDQEVRGYVRNRMAGDVPPDFTGNVMNQVHRTDQRRRGFAWPIFTGLATVAAAVAVVVIGLGLINQPNGVASEPTPSPSASPSASPSSTPEASATPSPSPEPTTSDGEFGPIHSMSPEEAFENGQSCESPAAMTTTGEPTQIGYTISFPEGWYTNDESETHSACTLFGPEPFEVGSDGMVPESVAIEANLPPGGDYGPGGSSVTTQEYTVDGVAAVRYDLRPESGGFITEPTIAWVIAIAGSLPGEDNTQPYLVISTSSADPDQFAEWTDIIDRMVATLDIAG